MEGSTTTAPAESTETTAATSSQMGNFRSPPLNPRHGILPPASALTIIIPVVLLVLLAAIAALIIVLRRLNSTRGRSSSRNSSNVNECKFTANTTANATDSPEPKNSCIHGGTSNCIPLSKLRGVQVFTYKDLELATDNFSEANVIGNARFGVVYRGILGDGTVAAIKVLHTRGKQGERAFRTEVVDTHPPSLFP